MIGKGDGSNKSVSAVVKRSSPIGDAKGISYRIKERREASISPGGEGDNGPPLPSP